ncbi:MAG: glycosyltransferase family 4 protein [Actinomycetota bacterium]|nr:glycosyltransferase family 4 protein [Actinomycetota bacterium]
MTTSVLIDARELSGESSASGVGTVIRGLLEGLARRDDIDVRAIATPDLRLPEGIAPVPVRRFATSGGRRAVVEHEVLLPFDLRRDDADVFHNPLFHPPWRVDRPWVQTLYDVIPLVFDDPNLDVLRKRWRRFAPRYRKADVVAAISRHAADEGRRLLDLDPKRLEVIPLAVDSRYRPGPGLADDDGPPYLLLVSEYSRRKGFADAFRVVAALADAGYPHHLRVAGRVPPQVAGELDALVMAADRPDRIQVLGFVPDLVGLYQGAAAVLVPSRYEGFGLPALEGMASGVPVVAYDNSSLPEVVGEGGLLVADGDTDALLAATRRVLDEASLAEELRERGPARAATFTWDAVADAYTGLYERVAR